MYPSSVFMSSIRTIRGHHKLDAATCRKTRRDHGGRPQLVHTTTWPHGDDHHTSRVITHKDPACTGGLVLDGAVMENQG
jgi:hypothetical protein